MTVMEGTLRVLGLAAVCASVGAGAPPPAITHSVDWWLGDYTGAYIAQNAAFLARHKAVTTGVLHCCRGVVML